MHLDGSDLRVVFVEELGCRVDIVELRVIGRTLGVVFIFLMKPASLLSSMSDSELGRKFSNSSKWILSVAVSMIMDFPAELLTV